MPGRLRRNLFACFAKSNAKLKECEEKNGEMIMQNCANKNVEQNLQNDEKNVPKIVISHPSETLPNCSMNSASNNAKNLDDRIELTNEKPSTSKQFTASTTKMVAARMEEWTEENSGWAKPASVHSGPIKEEWGKMQQNGWTANATAIRMEEWNGQNSGWAKNTTTVRQWEPIKEEWPKTSKATSSQQNGWTSGWNDYPEQTVVVQDKKWDELEEEEQQKNEKKWDELEEENDQIHNNNNRNEDHFGYWNGGEEWGGNVWTAGGGGGGWSTGNGTILVVSGLVGANIGQDELRTLVNFLAGNAREYGSHIIGDPIFPGNSADMAFFQLDSEAAARKSQCALEGFKVEGRHNKKLHAAIMPTGFGTNATMGNTRIEEQIPWNTGRFTNSPMPINGVANGGRDSNNFGEDQSDEMADNLVQHTHIKLNNVAEEEEDN